MPPFRETALGPRPIARGGKTKIVPPATYAPGTYTHIIPESGLYTFYLWGAGGPGSHKDVQDTTNVTFPGGGGGGFTQKTIRLPKGAAAAITVGRSVSLYRSNGGTGGNSTVSIDGGSTMYLSAGGGYGGNPNAAYPTTGGGGGSAGGGDINTPGGAGGGYGANAVSAGGSYAGAPGPHFSSNGGGGSAGGCALLAGGRGGQYTIGSERYTDGGFPGGGGGGGGVYGYNTGNGGEGFCLIVYEGP